MENSSGNLFLGRVFPKSTSVPLDYQTSFPQIHLRPLMILPMFPSLAGALPQRAARSGLAAALVFACGVVAASGARAANERAYVTVLDAQGAPITGLQAADFTVHVDGIAQEVIAVSPAVTPPSIVLLTDQLGLICATRSPRNESHDGRSSARCAPSPRADNLPLAADSPAPRLTGRLTGCFRTASA